MRSRLLAAATAAVVLGAGAANAMEPADLIDVRDKALKILDNNSMDTAVEKLGKPDSGLIDVEGSGLHTWAFKGKGVILWDHSGQAQDGMDISNLKGMNGTPIIKSVKTGVAEGKDLIKWKDELPHPSTGNVQTSYVSCDTFAENKYICAMAWVTK